jgi:glutamyl-Q tRNA(Asp) synthetase
METNSPVVRFAPSPNGYLHMGHALSALICWQWAKALDGKFLLRIEDTDISRSKPHFVNAIYEDLTWLGISWEEPVRVQSDHWADYQSAIDRLWQRDLLYPAPASRAEIKHAVKGLDQAQFPWPRDPDGSPFYPFSDRDREQTPEILPDDIPLRLDVSAALSALDVQKLQAATLASPTATPETVDLDPALWGDPLMRGRDRPVTYHLAVVVDDALQGVTHVVRGQDIQAATSLHRLLQNLLGLPALFYHHHRLIMGADGRKLSKSEGAKSLRSLRKSGLSRDGLIEQLLGAGP